MKNITKISLSIIITTLLLASCNLEKAIDIDLPKGKDQLVVECYLEHGKPYQLLLTETVPYLSPPNGTAFGLPDVLGATVSITHNNQVITLIYKPNVDISNNKVFNYTSTQLVDSTIKGDYSLFVRDTKGREITAKTRFLPKLTIKEISWEFQNDPLLEDTARKALVLVRHNKFSNTQRQRIQIGKVNNKDTLKLTTETDFTYEGIFSTNNVVTIGTRYLFKKKDTIFVRLFNIEQQYYAYKRSVDASQGANGNPFAQPVSITSGVQGGIGVFTTLVYDKRNVIIE